MLIHEEVKTYGGDLRCYELNRMVKGEELLVEKYTMFMTNSPCVGEA